MKILLVNKFHWLKGGSETYYFGLAEGLRRLGHEVIFFSMEDERNKPCDQAEYFVSASDYNGRTGLTEKFHQAVNIAYSKEAKVKFEKLLQAERPDIIHLNLTHRQITFSILDAPSAVGIPVVYTSHDYILVCPNYLMLDGDGNVCDECIGGSFGPCVRKCCVKGSRAKSILAKYEADYLRHRKTYSRIDRIIAPSKYMRDKLLEGGFPEYQVVTMRNFADEDTLMRAGNDCSSKKENTLFFFGRLSPEKGVDVLVAAFLAVMDFIPLGWRLEIAGEGPERDRLEKLISNYAVEDRIKLLGKLEKQEVLNRAERASFTVVSSIWRENMPYSIIESFACGTPVIGADIGGIPELVLDGETGFICESDNIESLASTILKAIQFRNDEDLYCTMQANCKRAVLQSCSLGQYVDDIVSLYEDVISARQRETTICPDASNHSNDSLKATVLADCSKEDLDEFIVGLDRATGIEWSVESRIANWGRSSFFAEAKRYFAYFYEPWRVFRKRDDYDAIIGWQQFYAINYALYCALFRTKKAAFVCAANYTYKEKRGVAGRLYRHFMSRMAKSPYLDCMHVPSRKYAKLCSSELGVSESKFLVTPFGITDLWDRYNDMIEDGGYALAIGRSNRDYDWLIDEWTIDLPLIIISDTYVPKSPLPHNVTLLSNISGDSQYPYIAKCRFLIMPMDDPTICSGDTVLLTGMALGKRIVVTSPSALAETYVKNEINGYLCSKDPGCLAEVLERAANKRDINGNCIRRNYVKTYSLESMGERLGRLVLPELESTLKGINNARE